MADNTKEIAELEARAKALRSEKNRQQAGELGELQVQETTLRRQVTVAKKGLDDANWAVERAHTEAAEMEKYARELDKAVEKNEYINPKQAAEDREQAEYARNAAVRAEQQARAARAEADEYRARHADLTARHEAAYQKAEQLQSRLGRTESLGIDQIEEKARLLRESDRLEKAVADLEVSIAGMRDRNASAKAIKDSEANVVKLRADAAKAEADAAKVKINEEVIRDSGLEAPGGAPPAPAATAEAGTSLLDDEAGLVAQAGGDALPTSGADDIVGDGSIDDAVTATADATTAGQAPAAPDLDVEPASPPGVPIPFPNEVEAPGEMADASALLADADTVAGSPPAGGDGLDTDGTSDPDADAGLDPLEA
jgi:hypothetical protein